MSVCDLLGGPEDGGRVDISPEVDTIKIRVLAHASCNYGVPDDDIDSGVYHVYTRVSPTQFGYTGEIQ